MNLKSYIPVVADWPKPGVDFLDITGLLAEPRAFNLAVNQLSVLVSRSQATSVVAIESRGFVFASPVAKALGLPLILVRKPGKLPGPVHQVTYDTEYSTDTLAIKANSTVGDIPFVIDDVLATGGTVIATSQLIRNNWNVQKIVAGTVIGLNFLPGRQRVTSAGIELHTLIDYE